MIAHPVLCLLLAAAVLGCAIRLIDWTFFPKDGADSMVSAGYPKKAEHEAPAASVVTASIESAPVWWTSDRETRKAMRKVMSAPRLIDLELYRKQQGGRS